MERDRTTVDSNNNNNNNNTPVKAPAVDGASTLLQQPRRQATAATSEVSSVSASTTTMTMATSNRINDRSAVVLALFGPSVGPCDLAGDFATTYNRVNGRLYAATKVILFYSNLFGFERRICLQLCDIDSIQPFRSTSIRISMVDCEEYVFRKFQDREAVLRILNDLHSKRQSPSNLQNLSNFSNVVTDGTSLTEHSREERDIHSELDTGDESSLRRRRLTAESTQSATASTSQLESTRPRAQSVPSIPALQKPQERSKSSTLDTSFRQKRFRRSQSQTSDTKMLDNVNLPPSSAMVGTTSSGLTVCDSDTAPPGFDMNSAWLQAKKPYSDVALEKISLACSVDAFMDIFISDEASYSIARYQQEVIQDREIHYSKWNKQQESKLYPPIFDRSIRFIHPLNNTVGPSQAKTNRQQRFQRFGTLGATLQNVTTIQGVPGAECFRMEDRWVLERLSDTTISLNVSFQLVFTKRTIFKPVIQKNSRAETKKWFRGYAKYIVRALQEDDRKDDAKLSIPLPLSEIDADTEDEPENPTISPKHSMAQSPGVLLPWSIVLTALFLMLGMAIQLLRIQQATHAMQQQLTIMQTQTAELSTLIQKISMSGEQC